MSALYEMKAKDGLPHLGLGTAAERLDGAAQRAAAEQWSYTHFLGYLLEGELDERQRKRVELNLKFAKFPYLKRLEDFDFSAQTSIDQRLIDELATGRFLKEGRCVVLLGPPGVGKTHLAKSTRRKRSNSAKAPHPDIAPAFADHSHLGRKPRHSIGP